MASPVFSLNALKEIIDYEEEEHNKLPYESFLEILQKMARENNPKIVDSLEQVKYNELGEYVCIKEPADFIQFFKGCNGQDENISMFKKLLNERDSRVIDKIIKQNELTKYFWFNSTSNGINLRPGLKDKEQSSPVPIKLGDDAVHALIAGRTGSGKSVFLNSIIFSLLAEYSPWELNLYLADFKKVEFSRYLSKCNVPHIRSVAATSEIRYVLSLLEYLAACMNARQNFFALIGQQKISEVRDKYNIIIPRILLIVDEFQQLFLEATSREQNQISDILTSITKLGRATGVHLVFASQEMSGTMSQSVFNNFKVGFALACDETVSSMVIGNSAAAKMDKKGFVLANVGRQKEDTNQLFKVPFISEQYFYEYLQIMEEIAQQYGFDSIHKFYQEDSIKDMEVLRSILDEIKDTRKSYLDNNSSLFDILTLGESVVFNYKKYDYETVFIERGVRKNIGVFSPSVDDTAYVCKLIAENFKSSPRYTACRHFVIARNEIFIKKYNLMQDLRVPANRCSASINFLDDIIKLFNRRKEESALLDCFDRYTTLKDFAYDAFSVRASHIVTDLTDEEKEVLQELAKYYTNKTVKDIPKIQQKILEDYEFDESFFRILNMLHKQDAEDCSVVDLFEPSIFWIIGAEMIGKFPTEMEAVLTDALNYNMLFVIVASNNDFDDFYMCSKSCDYFFVTGNNESYYNKLRMPYTKKSEGSIVVDFAISSSSTQRSFKKFKYDLQEVIVPEIDFDSILD